MALQTTEPILTAKAINHYYDHAYDFVYDQIVFPARRSIPHLEITSQQKGFLDEISKYPRVAIESGHGCHTKGTRILMRDGREKNVEDVEVGDQLLGSSGNCRDYRTVLRLKRGRQRCYKIEYRDGTGYEVNASHELCLVATQSHGRQVSGEKIQVKVDDYLDWSDRKKRTNAGYKTIGVFRKKHLCVPPYIMGLWLGDGSAGKPSITSVDKEVISKWDSYAKSLRLKLRRQKDEYFITSGLLKKGMKQHRNGFVSELKRYGVFSEKRIPFNYKTSTMKDRLELIAGLVDTDGCIDHGGYSITQKSKKLAEDILWVVRSLGFIAYIRKVRKKCHNSPTGKVGTYYTISFSGLCDLVPCRIERKRVAKSRKKRRNLHYMIKVTPIGVRNYYGFTLDGDNLYVLNDFSVLKNTGKSASLSWAGIWFITTRFNTLGYPVKIPSIAPTYHQLMDILWPEFRRWIALSRLRLVMKVQHEEIFFDKYKTEAFICARSPKKPENVQGFHAAHLFWLCDEAFGILDDLVWETIEGSMTEEDNRIVIAGQHTMISGYCHEAFTRDKERWRRLRFSSEDSPLAKTEYSDRIAEKYGRDSDIYRVRVSGMAPKGNPESFIQLERVLRATKREASRFGKATMGVDVARFGDDSTVVTMLAGNVVFKQEVRSKTNTDDICSLILHVLYEYREWAKDKNLVEVNVDNTGGYGAGVIDTLSKDRSNNIRVNPVNFTGKIKDPEYHDGVSKMWGELRDKIDDLQLPDDDFLVEELSTRTFKIVDGKVKIQPKSDFKTIYKSSPDRSDSLVLALTKKAAARRVWEGLLANDLKKDFVVDFHNLSNSSTLVCSQWVERDMRTYVLIGMWSAKAAQLYVMAEGQYDTPAPEVVVPNLNRMVQFVSRDVARNLSKFEWYGNSLMFERTRGGTGKGGSSMGDIREGYRRMDTYVQENTRYEEYGSIVLVGRLVNKAGLWIHEDCLQLPREMELWHIDDRGRPATDFGFCRSLCNMVSALCESGRMANVDRPMHEYSKRKTARNREIEDAAKADRMGEIIVYGGLEKIPDKDGWII